MGVRWMPAGHIGVVSRVLEVAPNVSERIDAATSAAGIGNHSRNSVLQHVDGLTCRRRAIPLAFSDSAAKPSVKFSGFSFRCSVIRPPRRDSYLGQLAGPCHRNGVRIPVSGTFFFRGLEDPESTGESDPNDVVWSSRTGRQPCFVL